ncbi:tRNA glutamyl-Q(34) synthetase GluQRS [Sphingobium sp. UBA5915]|jgi:glutamyl-Q tRNA(Asp) synthetase|uniref:tRNA glutamyl-Q(34) synthetase GluQRS n=1 Tax=Sphingobium sp. UBA5915 TaxID=1947530 RepID=UPI0025E8CA89|nr:tRNA glutamyl-Q(34) synthetase GluQRS [Sphingobium sp. UBA5915]MEE2741743.1 tRNA glutamyl-Q(34) synthetase GluQRS [Pseudomonadota bacterium]
MTRPVAPQHMVTRFAPSPTGRLHVGHGWSALMAMDLARGAGGTMRLRIEDIDGTRSRPEHVAGIIEDLRWLGVEWNGDILFQSQRIGHYMAALDRLRDMGLLYPCFCTRADIQASLTAPHGPEGPVYPGTCRALGAEEQTHRIAAGKAHAWRIDMAQATARAGPLCWHAFGAEGGEVIAANPAVHGDVVLARKDAPASYHLSCTLDDAAMGVTHVLRGADLRHATDIHRLLQAVLDLPSPAYRHHPLLVDAQGRRLAKRSGSLSLAQLRTQGIDPRVLAADLRAGRFPVGISGGKA